MPSSSTSLAPGFLLSGSKDTFLKLWDLSTQHCIQTVVAHRMEIWSLDLDKEQELLFTGSGEGELKAWRIDHAVLQEGVKETATGEVAKFIIPLAALPLSTRHRVSQVTFHPTLAYIAVQSHDRSVEIFRIRTEEEARRKQMRRRKRAKEKKSKSQGGKQEEQAEDQDEVVAEDEEAIELVDLFTPHLVVRASGKVRSFDLPVPETGKAAFPVSTSHFR
jgi:U3 small nucleolar RNA-associated protein 12